MIAPRRRVRIMLADPPVKHRPYDHHHPTMGILYLAAALRREFGPGELEVRYLTGHADLEDHVHAVADFAPDIYGLSFKTPVARGAFDTLTAVKQRCPETLVLAGGAHPTAMPADVLNGTRADACLRGECESSLPRLARCWDGNLTSIMNIPGAAYRVGDRIVCNPVGPFARDLDALPPPAWDLVDLARYPGMPYRQRHPLAGITVSRGCPYHCTFCSEPIWKVHGRPSFRARSIPHILDEVCEVHRRGAREIRLWSEELNADHDWACELLQGIAGLDLDDMAISANIRGDKVSGDLVDAMRAARMWMVNMGIESCSNRTLRGVRKQITIEQIEQACSLLAAGGVRVMGYMQFFLAWEEDGHLCWETASDGRRSLGWALDMNRRGHLHYLGTTISSPRPASPMWDLAIRHGLFSRPIDEPFPYLAEGMRLPGVTPGDVRTLMTQAYLTKAWFGMRSGGINLSEVPRSGRKIVRRLARL